MSLDIFKGIDIRLFHYFGGILMSASFFPHCQNVVMFS